MVGKRSDEWSQDTEVYSPDQVEAVLEELGIEVRDETDNDFLGFCPYHGNRDTPAFSVSKTYGYGICFNPACAVGADERLTLEKLVRDIKGVDHIQAKRFIMRKKSANGKSLEDRLADVMAKEPEELEPFPANAIERMKERLSHTPEAMEYLKGRGFTPETIDYFNVGFTPATAWPHPVIKPDMVVVPAYDHKGVPVGLVGRSIVGKEFKNFGPGKHGGGFHKSKIIWNLQNARRYETIILTESTFDAMRVHQAGYPNVGALLGGTLSLHQEAMLKRHFNKVIVMTDYDDPIYHRYCRGCLRKGFDMCQGHQPGRDLGMKIAERLSDIKVLWAAFDDACVYPHGAKDAGDMTDDEIRQCLRNAVSHYEYVDWMVA